MPPTTTITRVCVSVYTQGTTGGDREKLFADVQAGGGYAVIAPNMAKQIVALQVY